jgi:hypothetical protein
MIHFGEIAMNVLSPLLAAAGLALAGAASAGPATSCRAISAATAPTVVELYTSEGCSSCPPADRWLSTLKGRPDVLALAFHVNYWDQLGWADRYASPEGTARQRELARADGSGQVYTPQVRVDGRDWQTWPRLPAAHDAGPVTVALEREGDLVTASIVARTGAPTRLAGYWAVLEDGYQSAVKAGENAGETLHHDHVVRLYRPVPAWPATLGGRAQLTVSAGEAAHPRRVVFVVTDAATARPLQALSLGC